MPYVAVMKWDGPYNRVAKYAEFSTEPEAQDHVTSYIGDFPDAFVQPTPAIPVTRWRVNGGAITDRTQAEIDAEAAEEEAEKDELAQQLDFQEAVFKSFALVTLDEINALRSAAGLPERTVSQLKSAVRARL